MQEDEPTGLADVGRLTGQDSIHCQREQLRRETGQTARGLCESRCPDPISDSSRSIISGVPDLDANLFSDTDSDDWSRLAPFIILEFVRRVIF